MKGGILLRFEYQSAGGLEPRLETYTIVYSGTFDCVSVYVPGYVLRKYYVCVTHRCCTFLLMIENYMLWYQNIYLILSLSNCLD